MNRKQKSLPLNGVDRKKKLKGELRCSAGITLVPPSALATALSQTPRRVPRGIQPCHEKKERLSKREKAGGREIDGL